MTVDDAESTAEVPEEAATELGIADDRPVDTAPELEDPSDDTAAAD